MRKILLALFLLLLTNKSLTQSSKISTNNILQNVISVTEPNLGFGFIVGEHEGNLIIVTAGHTISNGNNLALVQKVSINFYKNEQYDATSATSKTSIATCIDLKPNGLDFALIKVKKPEGYQWKKDCISSPKVSEDVTFIGINSKWESPQPSYGKINKMGYNRIEFDGLSVSGGSSGAPLVGENGIIGLIYDAAAYNLAIPINVIKDEVEDINPGFFDLIYHDELPHPPPIGMVAVQGGEFTMGCLYGREYTTDGERTRNCRDDNTHTTGVKLSPFYMGLDEVTNALYVRFLNSFVLDKISIYNNDEVILKASGKKIFELICNDGQEGCGGFVVPIVYNPQAVPGSRFSVKPGYDHYPVVMVTKYGAEAYCSWLNQAQSMFTYRLPFETEWEFAARGGTKGNGYKFSGSNNVNNVAWHINPKNPLNHPKEPLSTKKEEIKMENRKQSNELGLYNMSGNVWEWCGDWYRSDYYEISNGNNPVGPPYQEGTVYQTVIRGGSWDNYAEECLNATRNKMNPDSCGRNIGFRIVCLPKL